MLKVLTPVADKVVNAPVEGVVEPMVELLIVAPVIVPEAESNLDNFSWPKIVQGSHLTVKTFEDGKTELIWDWDTLVNEVREACAGVTLTKSK